MGGWALVAAALLVAAAPPDPRIARLGAEAARARGRARAEAERLQALNAQEAALSARINRNRGELIRLLGALERWRSDPPPALLVSPRRAVDAARGALLMRVIAPSLERRARTLAGEAGALAAVRRRAAEADAALFAAESAAADRQEAMAAVVGAEGSAPNDPLLSADERAARARARAAAGLDPTPAAATAPALAPTRLLAPTAGRPALRWGDPWPGRGVVQGVVWRPAPGETVRAPADGVVEHVGPLKGFRLVVMLRLPGDWRVVLAGLQSTTPAPGARVAAGQPLGRAAPAGAPDGDLYLQLRDGARAVDPGPALGVASRAGGMRAR